MTRLDPSKFLLIFLCLLLPLWGFSQHDFDSLYQASESFRHSLEKFDLFDKTDPAEITITSDFRRLHKSRDESYQEAVITFSYSDTVAVRRKIKIRSRGNYRRKYCRYPPLLIKFPRKEEKIPQLQEFNKMKMVVGCGNNSQYGQYLISEYLIYRMYNQLTEYSFRVRLLKVKYVDLSGKYDPDYRYAFVIENEDQMAERLGGFILKVQNIHQDSTRYDLVNQLAVFQFMIGNTDWSVPALHNIKLVVMKGQPDASPVAVPYDFDFSGMVNAVYATPPKQLGITSVRERVFRGYCRSGEEMEACLKIFREKKKVLYSLYEGCTLLRDSYRQQCIRYLDEFYEITGDPMLVRQYMLEPCKNR